MDRNLTDRLRQATDDMDAARERLWAAEKRVAELLALWERLEGVAPTYENRGLDIPREGVE